MGTENIVGSGSHVHRGPKGAQCDPVLWCVDSGEELQRRVRSERTRPPCRVLWATSEGDFLHPKSNG